VSSVRVCVRAPAIELAVFTHYLFSKTLLKTTPNAFHCNFYFIAYSRIRVCKHRCLAVGTQSYPIVARYYVVVTRRRLSLLPLLRPNNSGPSPSLRRRRLPILLPTRRPRRCFGRSTTAVDLSRRPQRI